MDRNVVIQVFSLIIAFDIIFRLISILSITVIIIDLTVVYQILSKRSKTNSFLKCEIKSEVQLQNEKPLHQTRVYESLEEPELDIAIKLEVTAEVVVEESNECLSDESKVKFKTKKKRKKKKKKKCKPNGDSESGDTFSHFKTLNGDSNQFKPEVKVKSTEVDNHLDLPGWKTHDWFEDNEISGEIIDTKDNYGKWGGGCHWGLQSTDWHTHQWTDNTTASSSSEYEQDQYNDNDYYNDDEEDNDLYDNYDSDQYQEQRSDDSSDEESVNNNIEVMVSLRMKKEIERLIFMESFSLIEEYYAGMSGLVDRYLEQPEGCEDWSEVFDDCGGYIRAIGKTSDFLQLIVWGDSDRRKAIKIIDKIDKIIQIREEEQEYHLGNAFEFDSDSYERHGRVVEAWVSFKEELQTAL